MLARSMGNISRRWTDPAAALWLEVVDLDGNGVLRRCIAERNRQVWLVGHLQLRSAWLFTSKAFVNALANRAVRIIYGWQRVILRRYFHRPATARPEIQGTVHPKSPHPLLQRTAAPACDLPVTTIQACISFALPSVARTFRVIAHRYMDNASAPLRFRVDQLPTGSGTTKNFNRRRESGWFLRPRYTDEGSGSWRGPLVLTAPISYQWMADRHKIALRPARFPIYERFS
jgi:hypothetical protein